MPITLLVDDVAPGPNLYYHYIRQVELSGYRDPVLAFGPDRELLQDRIPLEMLRRFAGLAEEFGVRGKLSLVPCPAGLGSVTDGIAGVPDAELRAFLDGIRRWIVPRFDVTPEMLTHTRQIDLATGTLGPLSEQDFSRNCSGRELAAYVGRAVGLLRQVGLAPTGVTSPMDFGAGNERAYRRAIVGALASQGKPPAVCWYFLHQTQGRAACPRVTHETSRGSRTACVHIPATLPDHMMELYGLPLTPASLARMADRYISPDGTAGQIVELLRAGTGLVSVLLHWPALYLNGHYSGLLVLREILVRVREHLRGAVRWATPFEIASTVTGRVPFE